VRREGSRRRGAGTREAAESAVDATVDENVTKTTRADT